MNNRIPRFAGAAAVLALLLGAVFLYTVHPGYSSDHQDSPTMINRPGADITDVFVFPAPGNSSNVVLAMAVYPLIPAGQTGNPQFSFDPAVMYQFKIDNVGDHKEHIVIQLQANGTGPNQTMNVFGPAAPSEQGTMSTFVAQTGTVQVGNTNAAVLSNGMRVFAGPRQDPFFFDLARFFQIIPDRNYQNGSNPPAATATSFRGFTAAFNTQNGTACDTTPSQDFLLAGQTSGGAYNGAGPFNVLAIVVELPKTLLASQSGQPGKIAVWTTTSTTTGS